MPFDFSDVLAVIAPRPIFINAPLRDENFDARGVEECVDLVRPLYRATAERLQVRHPDCGHDFPDEIREEAWRFLATTISAKTKWP
jgi:hypothetical protein